MKRLQVHNKRIDVWFVVENGKVYDANTMIELPSGSCEYVGVLQYVKRQMEMLWCKMSEIDPIWGDLQEYHRLEREWLRMRVALYGEA